MKNDRKRRFRDGLIFAAAVILIYALIMNFRSLGSGIMRVFWLFSPLIIGIFFALILYKPMMTINGFFLFLKKKSKLKKHLPDKVIKTVSITLTVIFALLVLFFVGNSVVPQIIVSFRSIFTSLDTYYPQIIGYLEKLGFDGNKIEELFSKIDLSQVWKTLTDNATHIWQTAVGAVNGIANVLTGFTSALIFSIYLLSNLETLKRQTKKLLTAYFRPETAKKILGVGRLTVVTFLNFFSGQCLEAVILGTIFFIVLSLFGFPYATVISVIIGFTAIIPYVGSFIGGAVGVLLILMRDPMQAVLYIIVYLAVQQIENNFIYPKVVGTAVNLPAIWAFVAIVIGGVLFGVVGMLFFIPMASVLYTLLKNDVNARLKKKAESVPVLPPVPPADGAE